MSNYATISHRALETFRRKGSPVTFTVSDPGTYDETTGLHNNDASETTVSGYAMQDKIDPVRYKALELIESEAPTLLFAPNVRGSLPPVEAFVNWGGSTYKVRDIAPIAPDGTALFASIVVAR